ncbi:hypothetical protein [Variovorax sp. GT1P44]|uniref:hypothetical protein n=1 Tax=Variovorax sp. GT1P44 TaxID=3443742 RepID=UPI003F46CAD1
MIHSETPQDCLPHFELRFFDLFHAGRGYAFPCDTEGHVQIDSLGEQARLNYFYARAMVGREFSAPVTRLV